MLKRVFASEELGTNVTCGEYRQLEESVTAVDVTNAVFEWPYGQHRMANTEEDSEQRTNSTPKSYIGF